MKKFPDEVVLGRGFPWAMGEGAKYKTVGLCSGPRDTTLKVLKFPALFWRNDLPEYELVLRRLKRGATKDENK